MGIENIQLSNEQKSVLSSETLLDNDQESGDKTGEQKEEANKKLTVDDVENFWKEIPEKNNFYDYLLIQYGKNPKSFFCSENLEIYKDNQAVAFLIFENIVEAVDINLSDVERYFEYYPNHIQVAKEMFLRKKMDVRYLNYIIPMIFKILERNNPQEAKQLLDAVVEDKNFSDYAVNADRLKKILIDKTEKKELASKLLLKGFTDGLISNKANVCSREIIEGNYFSDEELRGYSVREKIKEKIKQSSENLNSLSNLDRFLPDEFEQLSQEQQVEILQWVVANEHYSMLNSELLYQDSRYVPGKIDNIMDTVSNFLHGRTHLERVDHFNILSRSDNRIYYDLDKENERWQEDLIKEWHQKNNTLLKRIKGGKDLLKIMFTPPDPDKRLKEIENASSVSKKIYRSKYGNKIKKAARSKTKEGYVEDRLFGSTNKDFVSSETLLFLCLKKLSYYSENKEEIVDFLVEFWEKNSNPIFKNVVVEALNNIDANLAGKKLLEILKFKGSNEDGKRQVAALLFRLEFGQIGISEKGVKYLERMYDLGELNNPEFFAQRLTAKGDVGIFDNKKVLQRYFNLGDLASQEQVVKPKIHEFVYETLFRKKEGETQEEKQQREVYLQEFRENYFDFYDDKFFEETGIRFNNLDFKEQGWFLIYYKKLNNKGRQELIDFAGQFGEVGLKSFLSLEYGQEMGDKIIAIGEQLNDNPEYGNSIFRKYVNMAEKADKIAEEFINASGEKNNIDKNKLIDDLLLRAKSLLDEAKVSLEDEKSRMVFFSKIENINAEIELLSQVVESSTKEDVANLDLREISGIQKIEEIPANEILNNKELLGKIKLIIQEQFPAGDVEQFMRECAEKNMNVTITMANNEILCLYVRDTRGNNVNYLDWFIANPKAPIKGIGEATIKLEFSRPESTNKYYYAVAKPYVKSFELMLEKFGFVAFAGSTNDNEYKHHYTRCRRIPADLDLKSKNLSNEHEELLIKSLQRICEKSGEFKILLFDGFAYEVCRVDYYGKTHKDDIKKTDPEGWFMNAIDKQAKKGYVLSRFIPDRENVQSYYAVFEKNNSSYEEEKMIWDAIDHRAEDDKDQSDSNMALSR